MRSPGRRLGPALLVVYVVVAVATAQLAPGRLRPLFDGFGSHPGVYNWLRPPKEFAEGNGRPDLAQARIAIGATGSSPVIAETPDGQAMAALPPAAVPPQPPDSAATLRVDPVDSTTLGPLPPGLRAEGNAYRIRIAYLPSDAEVRTVTAPGRVGVTSEVEATTLLFSADGQSWRPVEQAQPIMANKGFTAPLTDAGYFLAAGPGAPRAAAAEGDGPPVALFVVAAAVPLILGFLLLGRRRRATSS